MSRVNFQNMSFECSRAIKGANYIRLYDSNNIQIAAFEEVTDFSLFTITGGEWEAGKSAQRVVADASVNDNGSVFILNIKEKVVIEDGLCVSFDAPADSKDITTISIGSYEYPFISTSGQNVATIPNCFIEGAKLEIILSINNSGRVAYLQNSAPTADYIVEQGTTNGWTYRKWNSGIAECWGTFERKDVAVTNAIGSTGWYRSEILGNIYPSGLFTSVEYADVRLMYWSSDEIADSQVFEGTGGFQLQWVVQHNKSNAAMTFKCSIRAVGTWK